MNRTRSIAFLVSSLGVTGSAHADPVVWRDDAERVTGTLGAFAGGALRYEIRTQPSLPDVMDTLVRLSWPGGAQVLYEGLGVASAGVIRVERDRDRVTLRYPSDHRSADEGQTTEDVWRWREHEAAFVRERSTTTSPYQEGSARVVAALNGGDLAVARGELARIGPTPNAGHTDLASYGFERFLGAVHARSTPSAPSRGSTSATPTGIAAPATPHRPPTHATPR